MVRGDDQDSRSSTLDLRWSYIPASMVVTPPSHALRAATFRFSGGGEVRGATSVLVKLDGPDQCRGFRARDPIGMADAERMKTNH